MVDGARISTAGWYAILVQLPIILLEIEMWIFDYDKNEGVRELTAFVFTTAFVVGPPIYMLGLRDFLIGAGAGIGCLLAQFGIIYLISRN